MATWVIIAIIVGLPIAMIMAVALSGDDFLNLVFGSAPPEDDVAAHAEDARVEADAEYLAAERDRLITEWAAAERAAAAERDALAERALVDHAGSDVADRVLEWAVAPVRNAVARDWSAAAAERAAAYRSAGGPLDEAAAYEECAAAQWSASVAARMAYEAVAAADHAAAAAACELSADHAARAAR